MALFTVKFWKDATERIVASFAGALLSAGAILPGDFWNLKNLEVAGGAALVSLLKALVATRVNDPDSASLVI